MFPEIKFSDSIVIPTYILYLSILYCFLIYYAFRRAESHDVSTSTTLDFAFLLMAGGFLGARLVHILYELPNYYVEDWTRIFKFWEGGFVFYGGFIGGILSCVIYQRLKKLSFLTWADFFAPIIALGYGLGRVSCFLAGCCYGRACEVPWAVTFPWDFHRIARHPTQLYAVFWELSVFALLIWLEKRNLQNRKPGRIFVSWLALHSLGRLIMEYYRDDFRGDAILGLSVSSWMSLVLFAIAAGSFVILGFSKAQKLKSK